MSMIHDNALNYTTLYTRKSQKLDSDDLLFRKLIGHNVDICSNVIIVLWWCGGVFFWLVVLGLGWGLGLGGFFM